MARVEAGAKARARGGAGAVMVMKFSLFEQDEAARSAGEGGGRSGERTRECTVRVMVDVRAKSVLT